MRHTLFTFVQDYAAASGCGVSMEDGTCQGTLSLQGVQLHVGLLEESAMLILQLPVGVLPPDNDMDTLRRLLQANNLLKKTRGFTLGLEENIVTLQIAWDMTHLTSEGFTNLVNNMLNAGVDWMLKLDDGRIDDEEAAEESTDATTPLTSASDTMNFMQFLRV